MKISSLLVTAFALLAGNIARADDTAEFLNPANWEGHSHIWTIKDGSIIGETQEDPKYNTFLISKKKYADFEMSFKVELRDAVGNSGVQIRSEVFDPEKFRVKGPQVDIGKGYWGSLYGEGVGGMMKASKKEDIEKAVKETSWNEYHIIAKGPHITITINGTTMIDDDFKMLPGNQKDKPAPMEGVIAFQAHAGYPKMRVEFKDIQFKILK